MLCVPLLLGTTHLQPRPVDGPGAQAANQDRDGVATESGDLTELLPAAVDESLHPVWQEDPLATQEVWVVLDDRADLSVAPDIHDWAERGEYVVEQLQATATESQADLVALLDAEGADYETYWISNTVMVRDSGLTLTAELAAVDDVIEVRAPVEIEVPEPEITPKTDAAPASDEVAWGVDFIGADDVWSQYGVRGDGIVVATIDTGVAGAHPALASSFRGTGPEGWIDDYDYHWFDPIDGEDRFVDDNGHGTHVTGTMVGSTGTDQVGVAPGAQWVAARGCCPSEETLMAAAEWMLAPTRVDGSDPRADLRPHVVNNSWGTTAPDHEDTTFVPVMEAWAASGIMGVWSIGNSGSGCETGGSPGSLTSAYSVGSFDASGTIAATSSRGPGQAGRVKPDVSAPGASVVSSLPGGGYGARSGTSMAAPHVAGTVALLWSAEPSLIGDLEATIDLLNGTSHSVDDTTCGGTAEHNNVYGHGRLDALDAITTLLGDTPLGAIDGTVMSSDGEPVPGASVALVDGDVHRSARVDADGAYTTAVRPGSYQVTVSAVGFEPAELEIEVSADETTSTDIVLDPVPTGTLTGRIVDDTGEPLFAAVAVDADTGNGVLTDAEGRFILPGLRLDRPVTVVADGNSTCYTGTVEITTDIEEDTDLGDLEVTRTGPWTSNLPSSRQFESGPVFGYECHREPLAWDDTPGEELPPAEGTTISVDLPFEIPFYGEIVSSVDLSGRSVLIGGPAGETSLVSQRGRISWACPSGSIDPDRGGQIAVTGAEPERVAVITAESHIDIGITVLCQLHLHENGDVTIAHQPGEGNWRLDQWADLNTFAGGVQAPIAPNNYRFQSVHDFGQLRIDRDDWQNTFRYPGGFVSGTVFDADTGEAMPHAVVDLLHEDGSRYQRTFADENGEYITTGVEGVTYQVQASRIGWAPASAHAVAPAPGASAEVDTIHLTSAAPQTPSEVSVRDVRTVEVDLANHSAEDLQWRAAPYLPRDLGTPGEIIRSAAYNTPELRLNLAVTVAGPETYWLAAADILPSVGATDIREVRRDGEPTGRSVPLDELEDQVRDDLGGELLIHGMGYAPSGDLCLGLVSEGQPGDDDDPDPGESDSRTVLACLDDDTGSVQHYAYWGGDEQYATATTIDPVTGNFIVAHEDRTLDGVRGRTITRLTGFDADEPLQVVNKCESNHRIQWAGLAAHPGSGYLHGVGGDGGSPLFRINPDTCGEEVIDYERHEGNLWRIAVDAEGNLLGWTPQAGFDSTLVTIELADPVDDLPWVQVSPDGSVPAESTGNVDIQVDQANIPEEVDTVMVRITGNGGAEPTRDVEVHLGPDLINIAPCQPSRGVTCPG